MNSEEIQEKFEQLASAIDWIKTKLVDLQEEKGLAPVKTPYEVEVPEDIGNYYYVSESGDIDLVEDVFHDIDYEGLYQRGLAFKTREEAEQFDKERILINKLKNWAKEHQGDWTPDWSNFNETKRYITCKKEQGEFDMNFCRTFRHFIKLPYFKSVEIAKQFIEVFGEEIKEVLC